MPAIQFPRMHMNLRKSWVNCVAEAFSRMMELKLEIIFASNFQFRSEWCVTNTPLKQRLRCVSCFINRQKESQELLSSNFRCLAGSANKDCVSSKARTF